MKSSIQLSNLIILFLSIILCNSYALNENLLKDEIVYTLEEQRTIFDIDYIQGNHSKYIKEITQNPSKINLTNFEKNINSIKEKIYDITEHKNDSDLNKNLYIMLSSIYGAFLGDSMGCGAEFMPRDKNNHLLIYREDGKFKPGQVTDDSEMAMSLAYAIMSDINYKTLNPDLLYYFYLVWYNSKPLDIGAITKNALILQDLDKVDISDKNIFSEKIKLKIKSKNSASLANGFIMRSSPLLAWFYIMNKKYINETLQTKSSDIYFELYNKIHTEMAKDTQLTHPNEETAIAGSVMIFMGLCSMQENSSGNQVLERTRILFENSYFDNHQVGKMLKSTFLELLNEFSKPNFSKYDFFDKEMEQMGYYMHSYNLTIYYLSVFDKQKEQISLKDFFTNMMFDLSDFGGDTDTNGAIVGMIMGPLIGMENYDRKYLDPLLSFYSRDRLLYNNSFMYWYAYLLNILSGIPIPKTIDNPCSYLFSKLFIGMLNVDIGKIN